MVAPEAVNVKDYICIALNKLRRTIAYSYNQTARQLEIVRRQNNTEAQRHGGRWAGGTPTHRAQVTSGDKQQRGAMCGAPVYFPVSVLETSVEVGYRRRNTPTSANGRQMWGTRRGGTPKRKIPGRCGAPGYPGLKSCRPCGTRCERKKNVNPGLTSRAGF